MPWDEPLEFTPVMELDANFSVALNKMNEMKRIEASLPGLDCGSCGAPSCKALAEDVVRGFASVDDCVFKFRENVASLMDNINKLNVSIPQAYRRAESSPEDAEKPEKKDEE